MRSDVGRCCDYELPGWSAVELHLNQVEDASRRLQPLVNRGFGADDRDRTGDLNLGKVALYQLSHVRMPRAWNSMTRMTSVNNTALVNGFPNFEDW